MLRIPPRYPLPATICVIYDRFIIAVKIHDRRIVTVLLCRIFSTTIKDFFVVAIFKSKMQIKERYLSKSVVELIEQFKPCFKT